MTNVVRVELSGKRADAWNRIFETFTNVIEEAVDELMSGESPKARQTAKTLAKDIGEVAKGFIKAKLEKPVLENELLIAEIALRFEEIKLNGAKREQIEVETEIRRVALEKDRLHLWEQRMNLALRWLSFFQNHITRMPDGTVVLLLTNHELSALTEELREARGDSVGSDG